jgi:hypothetical protein
MTDQEREEYIKACGERMQKAYEAGNREDAELWLQAQNEAIKGRSAGQVARMEACFFVTAGEADKQALEGSLNA